MFFNKNGLKINLNFVESLNEKDISELESKKINKNLIRKESAICFSKTSKSLELNSKNEKPKLLRQYSYNFPIISKRKINKDYIINKTSKFDILKPIKIKESKQNIFEIIKLNNINIIAPKKTIETELKDDIKVEKEKEKMIEKKLFSNLNCFNSNNLFIEGQKKNIIIEIQNKINDIELKAKPKMKTFDSINISNKVSEIILERELISKESEIKSFITKNIEIKPDTSQKIYNLETYKNSFLILGTNKLKEEKILSIQNEIINFELIHKIKKNKKFKNLSKIRIINFDIITKLKKKKKKSPRVILKKVDGFGNINNRLFIKDIANKEIKLNEEDNNKKIKKLENKNDIDLKIDKFKIKSPNRIQIKINNNPDNINFKVNENNNPNKNKLNKIVNVNKENKNSITINTINNEIIYNKQSIDFPVLNTDILRMEEQYEKIKKDLNELYPLFNKNKKYRENFFMQLSQGNHDKYIFYLDLYKIIKDEREEKNNNYFENYLGMKKIIENNNTGTQFKLKNKLRSLKKNKSSHYIYAKDKTFPLYTET